MLLLKHLWQQLQPQLFLSMMLQAWHTYFCDEPSPQYEVQSALNQVIIKDVSIYCCIHLSLDPDYSPSSCCWKTSPQHDAATTMLHCRDGVIQVITSAWFPPDITLGIQSKEFNLSSDFIRPENFISHSLRVFQVPFGKLQVGCHVPFPEEWLPSGHSTIQVWLVRCCRNGCSSGRFSSLHRALLDFCQSDHRVLSHVPD